MAKFLLGNERTGIARLGKSKEHVGSAKEMARKVSENGSPLIEDPVFRQRVAQLEVDMKALEITQYRVVSAYDKAEGRAAGSAVVGAEGQGHRTAARSTELAVDVGGPMATPIWAEELAALSDEPDVVPEGAAPATGSYLFLRAASIYGGANEIQKKFFSKAVLRL